MCPQGFGASEALVSVLLYVEAKTAETHTPDQACRPIAAPVQVQRQTRALSQLPATLANSRVPSTRTGKRSLQYKAL